MDVAQLVERLGRVHDLPKQERRYAYGKVLGIARQLFPDFSGAVEMHRKLLKIRGHINPLDGPDRKTFERVFEQVPGLSKAYEMLISQAYLNSRQTPNFVPNQMEYWGTEVRFDSDLGRQL